MASPITPEMCVNTGRLMTEWFETAELTDDQVHQMACEEEGVSESPKGGSYKAETLEDRELAFRIERRVSGMKNRKWRHGMSQQEVAHRMNEATKMVNPDNFKFLDEKTRERTGLEINPLWMMECLIRSGAMTPKDMVPALKELASYTHSKAPSVNHNVNASAEDWLEELAKEEYEQIDITPPKQPRERGTGPNYERELVRRTEETATLQNLGQDERQKYEEAVDADFEEIDT